jgi:hypothetical protein
MGASVSPRMLFRIAIGLVAVTAITIFVALTPPRSSREIHLRWCGHPEDRWDKLKRITGLHMRIGATHCCTSARVLLYLRDIEYAQAVYQMDHGSYATSLDQLKNELPVLPNFQLQFTSDGTNWAVSVPQQGLYAGNYLLTHRHIYFNSAVRACTNDVVLWSR